MMVLAVHTLTIGTRLCAVDTRIESSQITAICGPNGAGKSTLLTALAGLMPPDFGHVSLDGMDIAAMHPRDRARSIGYLPQDGEVAWDVAVRSLVALGRMPHGDTACAPVERAMAALDLEARANRALSKLSGGERARALLARVLAGEPQWILADEPLAALDIGHQLTLLRHLRKVAENGAGVVLVLHDLALAMNHADRVLVLDQGTAVADGTPELALSADMIAQVWGVQTRWIGDPGGRALVVQ